LDRILSSAWTMTKLLIGKLAYAALLGFTQLTVMFLWGALVFQVELFRHLAGFLVMASVTGLASSALGLALASACKTRAQLSSLTTLVVLVMSALGGAWCRGSSMPEFPAKGRIPDLQRVGYRRLHRRSSGGRSRYPHLHPRCWYCSGARPSSSLSGERLARRWEVV